MKYINLLLLVIAFNYTTFFAMEFVEEGLAFICPDGHVHMIKKRKIKKTETNIQEIPLWLQLKQENKPIQPHLKKVSSIENVIFKKRKAAKSQNYLHDLALNLLTYDPKIISTPKYDLRNEEISSLLLLQDDNGDTPIHSACKRISELEEKFVEDMNFSSEIYLHTHNHYQQLINTLIATEKGNEALSILNNDKKNPLDYLMTWHGKANLKLAQEKRKKTKKE